MPDIKIKPLSPFIYSTEYVGGADNFIKPGKGYADISEYLTRFNDIAKILPSKYVVTEMKMKAYEFNGTPRASITVVAWTEAEATEFVAYYEGDGVYDVHAELNNKSWISLTFDDHNWKLPERIGEFDIGNAFWDAVVEAFVKENEKHK